MGTLLAVVIAASGPVGWGLPCAAPSELAELAGRFAGEVKVSATPTARGWKIAVELPNGKRTFTAATCALGAQAASLVLRTLAPSPPSPQPTPPPLVEPTPPGEATSRSESTAPLEVTAPVETARKAELVRVSTAPVRIVSAEAAAPEAPQGPRLHATTWLGSAAVVADLLPPTVRVSTAVELSGETSWLTGIFRFGATLPLGLQSPNRGDDLIVGVDFETGAAACLLPTIGQRLRLGACLGGGVEYANFFAYEYSFDPYGAFGAPTWWFSLALDLRAEWVIASGLSVYLGGGPALVLVVQADRITPPTIFSGAPVLGRVELGLGWRW